MHAGQKYENKTSLINGKHKAKGISDLDTKLKNLFSAEDFLEFSTFYNVEY